MELDIAIVNGIVLDGSGKAARQVDIGISGGTIAIIDNLHSIVARQVIDASGLYVCPGFIDAHCHTDVYAEAYPNVPGKIMQGVTTDVCGLCGFSPVPIGEGWLDELNARSEYRLPGTAPLMPRIFSDYVERINGQGNATNMAMFVGNANLRIQAMGYVNRPPYSRELTWMADMLREAMQEGALGLSTGLTYVPSQFAGTEELIQLCRSMAPFGGIYNSHMRNESSHVEDSIREVIRIVEESGCRGHVSHLKIMGKLNHGRAQRCLEIIHTANSRGIPITFDVYPYTAGSCGLRALLPPSLLEKGVESNPTELRRDRTRHILEESLTKDDWDNLALSCGYGGIFIGTACGDLRYEGRNIEDIARQSDLNEAGIILEILAQTGGQATILYHALGEADLRCFLKDPLCMLGTDAFARDYCGQTAAGKPHPRNYGAFPRYIRHYLLLEKLFPLEEGIRRITSLPARTFGLAMRGEIKEGYVADLTLFDPARIGEVGNYQTPNISPAGVAWVLVAGKPVVCQGVYNGSSLGRIILHQ